MCTETMSDSKISKLDVFTLFIALSALAVSTRSCNVAEQAIEQTEQQFIAGNRPYLVVHGARLEKTNDYLRCTAPSPSTIRIEAGLKVENQGTAAAKDINVSGIHIDLTDFGYSVTPSESRIVIPPTVVLAPNDDMGVTPVFEHSGLATNVVQELLALLNASDKKLLLTLRYEYGSSVSDTARYSMTTKLAVGRDEVLSLGSTMDD